jgi:hypothetical protein
VGRTKRLPRTPRSHLTLFLKTTPRSPARSAPPLSPSWHFAIWLWYQARPDSTKNPHFGSIGGSDPFCVRFESIEFSFRPLGIKRIFLFIRRPGSSVSLTSFSSPPLRDRERSTAPVHIWYTLPLFRYKAPRFLTGHKLSSLTSSHLTPTPNLDPLKPPSHLPWAVVSRSRVMSPSCTPSQPPTRLFSTSTLSMLLPSISHKSRIKDESALRLCRALGDDQRRARRKERSWSLAKQKLVHTSPQSKGRMVPGIVTVSLVPRPSI